MQVKERLQGLARFASGRPVLTIGIVGALALAGALLALGLKPSAGTDTFVSRSSATSQATDQDHREFGGDAVIILMRNGMVQPADAATMAIGLRAKMLQSGWIRHVRSNAGLVKARVQRLGQGQGRGVSLRVVLYRTT